MTALVRAEALRGYGELVASLGGDPAVLLRAAQIPGEAVGRPDQFVSFRAMLNLLEMSAAVLDCADFGLRLAERQDVGVTGPVALAAQNCETVGDAIACFQRFMHTHNEGLEMRVRTLGRGTVLISQVMLLRRAPPHTQLDERNVAMVADGLRLLGGNACRPQRALLTHDARLPLARYRTAFGCPVEFGQDCAGLEVSAADLRRPIRGQNPRLRRVATEFLERLGAGSAAALRRRVRDAVKPLLGSGRGDNGSVAHALHLHPRTLQRRLADEGTSFDAIRDDVRREMAEHYLTSSALPLSQISALLGYGEQSALTRSCRRWFGRPPLAMRKARPR